jgi:putative nucleotidyltransferase with HDIG domain
MPLRKKGISAANINHQVKPYFKPGVAEAIGRIRELEGEIAVVVREMQEKVQQLEYLTRFSASLNSTLDTAVIGEKALEATCQLLRCEAATLLLIDRQRADLYWESAPNSSMRLPIDNRSIAGYVAMTGESLIVNDLANDLRNFRCSGETAGGFQVRSIICVPLRARGRTIGVLQARNKLASPTSRSSRHSWPDFFGEDLRLLETLSYQVAIAVENAQLYMEIKKNFFETIEALAETIEKKDHFTGGHTKRVVKFAESISRRLRLSSEQIERIRLGAILHDVGKIGIADKLLQKEADLTEAEKSIMRSHTEFGYDILRRVEGLRDIIGGMRYHHERWDGNGYPLGLRGDETPLVARIIAVADCYDAMVSTRPYREGMDPGLARDEIVRNRGTQFDPLVVDAFEAAYDAGEMGNGSSR